MPRQPEAVPLGVETLTIVLLLRAFASGSVALTGIEAIANGVPAFKPPRRRTRPTRWSAMAVLLGIMFIGITFVARAYDIVPGRRCRVGRRSSPRSRRPRSAATARRTSCSRSFTALILFLAANTSFNAFPRLAAILAEDGYFPRQFSFRGDRLAYSWGIVLLAAIAAGIYIVFCGDTTSPDPALLRRRVRVLHALPVGHGPPLVRDPGPGLAVALAINAFGTS